MADDEAVKAAVFRPMNVLTVIKLSRDPEKPVDIAAASKNIKGQIPQISLALRTAFMNPKFIPIVMNLGTSEMLDNITAIAPGLKNDPVGVGMSVFYLVAIIITTINLPFIFSNVARSSDDFSFVRA